MAQGRGVRTFLAVGGLTALALGLRLAGVGHESLWYDEAFTLFLARSSAADLMSGRAADPGNPGGYFALVSLWGRALGPEIESARALSAVTGALAVPAVWLLGLLAGVAPRARLLACLLVAVSPPLVYLGQEARVFA